MNYNTVPIGFKKPYSDIVTPELLAGAIDNNEYEGFLQDYHALHCLIRKYQPLSFMEIGTSIGTGTNIICNAGRYWFMQVYSLDNFQDNKERTGTACNFQYTQLRGDSLTFDFSKYPCEGYFIDGAHDFEHVYHEATEVLKHNPKVVICHDANIPVVMDGIVMAVMERRDVDYDLYLIENTRIAYALRK